MDTRQLRDLLDAQSGVIARRQLLGPVGAAKHDIERLVRRRELTRVHPGVYVHHTGPLTWPQRAWAAVLYAGPRAALCLESVGVGSGIGPGADAAIHVAIEAGRRVTSRPGVRLHRVEGLTGQVRWNASPPHVRIEQTVIELAHRAATRFDAIRVLCEAVASRRTTPARLREALATRARTHDKRFLERLLDDLEQGTHSVLEHGYLTRVERPHGLPRARRQRPRTGAGNGSGPRREYRDTEYESFGLVVELDGRAAHDGWTATNLDAGRDLDDHVAGREAVRLRWAQVFGHPCRTATALAVILRRRGWAGRPHGCGLGCPLA